MTSEGKLEPFLIRIPVLAWTIYKDGQVRPMWTSWNGEEGSWGDENESIGIIDDDMRKNVAGVVPAQPGTFIVQFQDEEGLYAVLGVQMPGATYIQVDDDWMSEGRERIRSKYHDA